ncbi:hypothetical protein BDQ17DRAFT_1358464 [Cyathus striatus]|nr:hypothetical protein BDQ17DRAFT_1358464 [Cyathus striatus]
MLRASSRRVLLLSKELWFPTTSSRRYHLNTLYFDPSIRDFTVELARKQPAFSIAPECIRILSEPPQFYDLLLDMIRRAERRIFISSLYIGSAESELIMELANALREKSSLNLHLQLDLNRSTRPGASSTAKILLPLLQEFPSRVHVSMFRSPSLRGLMAKLVPPRFNEGWGTWHAKIYGVDDEVMISGANLNKSYFTNRQDRYLHFDSQPELAQYCFDFLKTVSEFSFRLLPTTPSSRLGRYSVSKEGYTLHWPDSDTHPHDINLLAELLLSSFQASRRRPLSIKTSTPSGAGMKSGGTAKAVLFPVIQAGQFNIREEETAFDLLFKHLNTFASKIRSRPLLDLTSGYFSLFTPYQKLILGSPNVDCRIVASSPKANGFFGSNGISGRIPEGYTLFEQRFMRAVARAKRLWQKSPDGTGHGVQLSEWEKKGWTYHAKGIWVSPNAISAPVLTLFGSTNLNLRSSHLDTELSFLLVVPSETPDGSSEKPQSKTAGEGIYHSANDYSWKGGEREVRFTTKVIVWLVKGML